jgi:hypothetical protein
MYLGKRPRDERDIRKSGNEVGTQVMLSKQRKARDLPHTRRRQCEKGLKGGDRLADRLGRTDRLTYKRPNRLKDGARKPREHGGREAATVWP